MACVCNGSRPQPSMADISVLWAHSLLWLDNAISVTKYYKHPTRLFFRRDFLAKDYCCQLCIAFVLYPQSTVYMYPLTQNSLAAITPLEFLALAYLEKPTFVRFLAFHLQLHFEVPIYNFGQKWPSTWCKILPRSFDNCWIGAFLKMSLAKK